MNSTENTNSEIEINHTLLTPEMFEDLTLPEIITPYGGKGSTSSRSIYDQEKLEYITNFQRNGIKIDLSNCTNEEGEITDRAIFVTTFIVLGHMLVLGDQQRKGEDLSPILPGVIANLEDNRIDKYSSRFITNDGRRLSDHYNDLNFSSNPTQKVTREELSLIIENIHKGLSTQNILIAKE